MSKYLVIKATEVQVAAARRALSDWLEGDEEGEPGDRQAVYRFHYALFEALINEKRGKKGKKK